MARVIQEVKARITDIRPSRVVESPRWRSRDWGGENPPPVSASCGIRIFTVLALPVILVGAAGYMYGGPLAAVIGGWITVAGLVLGSLRFTARVLRSISARRISLEEAPRIHNVLQGLTARLRIPVPALYEVPHGGPNALVLRGGGPIRGSVIVVSRALRSEYSRTEMEAVIAHCLVRLYSRHFRRALLGVAIGRWAHECAPVVGFGDDVRTCSVTRYPPALASAIAKAQPHPVQDDPALWRSDGFAPLWFLAEGPSHRPAPERIEALRDL